MKKAVKWVIILIAVANATFYGAQKFYPGLILLVEPGVVYRSPYCSVRDAMAGVSTKLQQERTADTILAASTLVKSENKLDLWQTPKGQYWLPTGRKEILPILLAQQERNIYGDETWGVRKGDIVLDCGAHVGTYTKKALAAGASLVVAIEPAPAAVECLRRNLAGEVAQGRVIIYPKGVWDREELLTLFADKNADAGDSFVIHENASKAIDKIPVTTIDQLASELKLPRVDFIKADVKGSTQRAIRGAAAVINKYHPRMAFSTEETADDPKAIAALTQTVAPGYRMRCGPCLLDSKEVYTDVLFFRYE
jgi:FkbM family methyltransferase